MVSRVSPLEQVVHLGRSLLDPLVGVAEGVARPAVTVGHAAQLAKEEIVLAGS